MTDVVVAYVPVLHEGYHRFLDRHGRGKPVHLIGPELYTDYRPLAKDIRALDPDLVRAALIGWDIASEVTVLDVAGARALAERAPAIVLPAEDVSYAVTDAYFSRCPVFYDSVFLRWDKSRTVQLMEPKPHRTEPFASAHGDLWPHAHAEAAHSLDWWRQVGAAMRLAGGVVLAAANEHWPHPQAAYAVGDPRSNFYKGVHFDLSTATHAEARLIGEAAQRGLSTQGSVMAVTDFPCPACAKLIAAAGVARLLYERGYAVLDGNDVLEAAGVEVVRVADAAEVSAQLSPAA